VLRRTSPTHRRTTSRRCTRIKTRLRLAVSATQLFLEQLYPGVKFVFGNGLNLPFNNQSFDFVHSSAVLEHVGSYANQRTFIRECARVARKGFFLTTPNRWFPVEFHTQLPLIHWLPKRQARLVFEALGYRFFADEANLNLMSRSELKTIAQQFDDYRISVRDRKLLGWPSNLLVIGQRLSR
jgi:ubiquinone/menaquinone biosynthesis C-methylase UbiE